MNSKLCIQHTLLVLSEYVILDLLNKNIAKQETNKMIWLPKKFVIYLMILLSYVSYSVTILYFWCIKQTTIIFYCLRKWITLIVNRVTRIMQTLLFSGLWYCYKKISIEHKLNGILSWLAIYNRLTPIKIRPIFVFIFVHFMIVFCLIICIDIW